MKKLLWILFGALCILFSLYPIKYILAEKPILLLTTKPKELLATYSYTVAFYFHIVFGAIALLIGWLQFIKSIRLRYGYLHRLIGKCYLISVLLSGIPGFYIALYASGGWSPKLGFSVGAVLWVLLAVLSYTAIKNGRVKAHRNYMMYNYAGTFGAVTLRLWLPVLILIFGKFITAYQIVAWLSWLPNMLVVYFMIRKLESRSATQKSSRASHLVK